MYDGKETQHIFLYESMHTCTTPDASVTLYDTSLIRKDKVAEQYHTTIPEYQAPDISTQKKSVDISCVSSKRTRKHRNTSTDQQNNTNVIVDDILSLSFPCWKQLTSWNHVKHSTYHLHNQCVNSQ